MFGILNLNKPSGPTSRDCVNRLQRLVRPHRIGHAGTLDPIADGVLVIPIGPASRLADWIHRYPKSYVADFELGVTSPSFDIETTVTPLDSPPQLSRNDLENQLHFFLGKIEQTPPTYSAIRINGKHAYDLARQGSEFEMPKRTVEIFDLQLLDFSYPKIRLNITCSTGTYIRSLGRDLARSLHSDAVMTRLSRTSIGPYTIEQSIPPESLQSIDDVAAALLPPRSAVGMIPHLQLDEPTIIQLFQGKRIALSNLPPPDPPIDETTTEIAILNQQHELCSILRRSDHNQWHPFRNFITSNHHLTTTDHD